MFAPFLLTLVLVSVSADDPPDAAALIGRLGAESFDDRVAAYKALERLGSGALPALRAAADTSDARVRSRVRALIDSIGRQAETDRLSRSTMIRLDFLNRPLGEVVETLNERHDLGLFLRLGPEPRRGMMFGDNGQAQRLKELKGREITLESAQPVPFWEAIDRICTAGALRYDTSPRAGFGTNQGFLALMADRTGHGPVSDSGPIRVQITGVNSVFERDFTVEPDPAQRGAKPPGAGDLNVSLAVIPEPDLMLHWNGSVIITEATDDRGRSLAPGTPTKPDPLQSNRNYQAMRGMSAVPGNASIQASAILVAPDPPGTVIRRLVGKMPVVAVTRSSDPIVIPLKGEGVLGKPFSTREMTLVVDEASLAPGAPVKVKVTFRFGHGNLALRSRPDPQRPDYTAFNRDQVLQHLELHDETGRRINHTVDGQTRGADRQGFYDSYTLTVSPILEDGPAVGPKNSKTPIPSELRYYGFVQFVTEVPFEFRDIPMP